MLINVIPGRCTGCMACTEFCSITQEGIANPELSRIHIYKNYFENVFLPIVCVPCEEKPCINACPENQAIGIDPNTGAVVINEEYCTGCSKCVRACEIGAIQLLRKQGRGKNGKAVVIKCNQCEGDPWCVKVCQPQALQYVEPEAKLNGAMIYDRLLGVGGELFETPFVAKTTKRK